MQTVKQTTLTIVICLAVVAGVSIVSAWTGPTATPPGDNTPEPINVGGTSQLKTGALGIGGLLSVGAFQLQTGAGASKVLTSDADGLAAWQTPTSGIGGSGTANYLSKWTAGSSLGNSIIYDNGTNVGIGTVNPQQKLDVAGWISVAGGGNTASNGIGGGTNSTNGPFVQLFGGLFPNVSRRGELANVSFGSGNITFFNEPSANVWNQLMTITPAGHVGIGTGASSGAINLRGGPIEGGQIILNAPNQSGEGESSSTWSIDQYTGGLLRFFYGQSGIVPMVMTSNGNVGIGTMSPGQKLDVAGYVKGQTGLCIGNDCRTSWPAPAGDKNCGWSDLICGTGFPTLMSPNGAYVKGVMHQGGTGGEDCFKIYYCYFL